jgi:cyclase
VSGSRSTWASNGRFLWLLFYFSIVGIAKAQDPGLEVAKAGSKHIQALHVRGNVYMLTGAGCNITVQVGEQYVIIVDAGLPQFTDEVIDTIRQLTSLPIMFLGNTAFDPEYTGGNAKLFRAGWALPNATRGFAREEEKDPSRLKLLPGTTIVASLDTVNRTKEEAGKTGAITFGREGFKLYNNESVFFYRMPKAHTDGDAMALFRASDVVSAGPIFSTTAYPVIDSENGGTVDGYIDALNELIDLLVPKYGEEGGTYVVPGQGHLSDRADVVNYRDMVTIIRSRVQYMAKKGMTLEQIEAAKPSLDYDGIYGVEGGVKYIEAVYRDFSRGLEMGKRK